MPPKQRINRDMILEASFTMFCQEGMEVINARSVAKALNCSTQPIFSYFVGMEDLKTALEAKARMQYAELIDRQTDEGDPLLEICKAHYQFSIDQPKLFCQLFLSRREGNAANVVDEVLAAKVYGKVADRYKVSEYEAQMLCSRLWVYTHGYATLEAMGLLHITHDQAMEMILEAYDRFSRLHQ